MKISEYMLVHKDLLIRSYIYKHRYRVTVFQLKYLLLCLLLRKTKFPLVFFKSLLLFPLRNTLVLGAIVTKYPDWKLIYLTKQNGLHRVTVNERNQNLWITADAPQEAQHLCIVKNTELTVYSLQIRVNIVTKLEPCTKG